MPVADYAQLEVVTVRPDQRLSEAAELMQSQGVGALVAVEDGVPVGIVTDRDLALAVLDRGVSPEAAPVAEVMQQPVQTLPESAALQEAGAIMAAHGVRRVPLTDASGRLSGLLAADDVVCLLAREFQALGDAVDAQRRASPLPARGRRGVDGHFEKRVVTVAEAASAREVATGMSRSQVGCVIVVDHRDQPVGIVTDRDLATRLIARGLDKAVDARALMSAPLAVIDAGAPLEEAVEVMRARGVRRLPVTRAGALVGLVSLDDLLEALSHELRDLAVAARHAIARSRRAQRIENLGDELHRALDHSLERAHDLGEKALERFSHNLERVRDELRRSLS